MANKKLYVIVECWLRLPTNAENYQEAIEEVTDYELPTEYVEDTFELVRVEDYEGNEVKED